MMSPGLRGSPQAQKFSVRGVVTALIAAASRTMAVNTATTPLPLNIWILAPCTRKHHLAWLTELRKLMLPQPPCCQISCGDPCGPDDTVQHASVWGHSAAQSSVRVGASMWGWAMARSDQIRSDQVHWVGLNSMQIQLEGV